MWLTNGSGCPVHSDFSVSCEPGSELTPPLPRSSTSELLSGVPRPEVSASPGTRLEMHTSCGPFVGVGFISLCCNKPSTSLKSRSHCSVCGFRQDAEEDGAVLLPPCGRLVRELQRGRQPEEPRRLGSSASCFPGGETESPRREAPRPRPQRGAVIALGGGCFPICDPGSSFLFSEYLNGGRKGPCWAPSQGASICPLADSLLPLPTVQLLLPSAVRHSQKDLSRAQLCLCHSA